MGHICDSEEFKNLFKYLEFKDISLISVQEEFKIIVEEFFNKSDLKVNGILMSKARTINVITIDFGQDSSIVTIRQAGSEVDVYR